MSDRAEKIAQSVASEFFAACPPPDAQWFVDNAMTPILRDIVAIALRAYAEEVIAEHARAAGDVALAHEIDGLKSWCWCREAVGESPVVCDTHAAITALLWRTRREEREACAVIAAQYVDPVVEEYRRHPQNRHQPVTYQVSMLAKEITAAIRAREEKG